MHLQILTPEKNLFEGEITGVQLPGEDGSFEILNNHAPMIASLSNGRVRVNAKDESKPRYFTVESGFVEVLDKKVVVLV